MRRNSVGALVGVAGLAIAVILGIAGGLLTWGSAYIHNTVHNQLAAQQIYFPPAAAFAHAKAGTEITPGMIPSVSQYAGQQMLTGQQAEAYADHFIAVHIAEMGAGKTYSQLSAESLAQPNNVKLATTVATVFKGETLRSMLLNAFGWWKASQVMYIASLSAGPWPARPLSAPGSASGPAATAAKSTPHRRWLLVPPLTSERLSPAHHPAGTHSVPAGFVCRAGSRAQRDGMTATGPAAWLSTLCRMKLPPSGSPSALSCRPITVRSARPEKSARTRPGVPSTPA